MNPSLAIDKLITSHVRNTILDYMSFMPYMSNICNSFSYNLFFSYWHEKVPSTEDMLQNLVLFCSVFANHLIKKYIASTGELNQYLNWLLSSQLLQVANYLPFLDNLALFLHKVSNISTSNNN